MLQSLTAFSWFVIVSLRELGLVIGDQEAEDYLYLWRVIGHMLGIDDDVLPESAADHQAILDVTYRHELGPSPEGVRLTRALLDLYASLLPAHWVVGAVDAVVRQLVGHQVADWLEVPRTRWDHLMAHEHRLGHLLGIAGRHAGLAGRLVHHLGERLLEWEVDEFAGHRRAPLDIPDGLRQTWEQTGKLKAVTLTYGDLSSVLDVPHAGP